MLKMLLRKVLIITFLFLWVSFVFTENLLTAQFSAISYLDKPLGIRGYALGESGTAYPFFIKGNDTWTRKNPTFVDIGGIWFNPAIAGAMEMTGVSANAILPENKYLLNAQANVIGLFKQEKIGVLGGEINYYFPGSVKIYNSTSGDLENKNLTYLALSLIYGKHIKIKPKISLYVGANFKFLSAQLVSWGFGFAGDIGAIFRIKDFYVGLSGKNLGFIKHGTASTYEFSPFSGRLGLAYDFKFAKPIGGFFKKILFSADIYYSPENLYYVNAGIGTEILFEFSNIFRLSFRLGYKALNFSVSSSDFYAAYTGIRGGIGLNIKGLTIDYGIGGFGLISGIVNNISISTRFGGKIWQREDKYKGKVKVVIVTFYNTSANDNLKYLEESIPSSITTALVQNESFIVIENSQWQRKMKSSGLKISDMRKVKNAIKVANKLEANVIITGSFLAIGGFIKINANIIDVETGNTVASSSVKGKGGIEIFDLIDEISEKLSKEVSNRFGKKTEQKEL